MSGFRWLVICVVLLPGLLAVQGCKDAPAADRPAATPSATRVRSEILAPQTLVRRFQAIGTLRADESADISAEISGRISHIHFVEGERVEQGALLFQLDDQIDRAELARAEAELTLARRSHERATELSQRRLVSNAEVDQALSALRVAEAEVAVARARLAKMRITAPFSGVTGLRTVSPGAYVSPGEVLVNLEAIDRMKLEFRVPESLMPFLKTGQSAQVSVDAVPDTTFDAVVDVINPRASQTSRSLQARARVDNGDSLLRPGLFARIDLELGRSDSALMAPEVAVFPRGDQNFVYRITAEDTVVLTEVALGQREPGKVEVVNGLDAGDEVVTGGLQRLADGASIRRSAEPQRGG